MTWEERWITVPTQQGMDRVVAECSGVWGVHPALMTGNELLFSVTHLPTGLRIGEPMKSRERARKLALVLMEQKGWDDLGPDHIRERNKFVDDAVRKKFAALASRAKESV